MGDDPPSPLYVRGLSSLLIARPIHIFTQHTHEFRSLVDCFFVCLFLT